MSIRERTSVEARVEPYPVTAPGPVVWLLGAHGGAGVSTLAQYWSFAGDAKRQWPCGNAREIESPYVVVVCRETIPGLSSAHDLILEHRNRGLACELLGLVTVANAPGQPPKEVRQLRSIVTGAVAAHWAIGWHRFLASAARSSLPTWRAPDGVPIRTKGAVIEVPEDVIAAGVGIVTAIQSSLPALWSGQ
ncbi:DUF6668 family protein [Rhodococcus aetherivorans]|uniref:DUF6668 family protein n=1 Tax=Rhodococcus aetherivorans TaxID=191292 RepID=UPI002948C55B|nr:DUF6668 family protein [Rhodococcus aetherivorans]MDV6296506.1 DUF6668 family protein [Rhodococcus aetherivorans]